MKLGDIQGLTPKQIQDKYSLSYTPDLICDVSVASGSKLRTGAAANVEKLGTGRKCAI
jgi:hypothetical protein